MLASCYAISTETKWKTNLTYEKYEHYKASVNSSVTVYMIFVDKVYF
jgi:hypothetical protein